MTNTDSAEGIFVGRAAVGSSPIPVVDPVADDRNEPTSAAGRHESSDAAPDGVADLVALAAAVDEPTIRGLSRGDLEVFVNLCHHVAGDTPLCTFAGISDEELVEMALRVHGRLIRQR